MTAGANFQLFYQKSFLLPHRRATWIRFTERLDEAAEFADAHRRRRARRAPCSTKSATTLHQLAARVGSRID